MTLQLTTPTLPDHWTSWCAPAVIAAVTGLTTDQAEREVQLLRGNRRPITGVTMDEIMQVLRRLGYTLGPVVSARWQVSGRGKRRPTLKQLVDHQTPAERMLPHVVVLAGERARQGHVIALQNGMVFDNHWPFRRPVSDRKDLRLFQKPDGTIGMVRPTGWARNRVFAAFAVVDGPRKATPSE